ncbi:hypothetical protein O4J56_31690 [Nocardiopsis sp. RSe5-2]|uniref:Uncharacterized protein n=1 Tax=Nocardiopsis endophytica TaxID=3018445 RepID=A0ABT4UE80_9ACTN|nr:hypothetical protein [Nocardiopsis endophytica]MDA2815248.1 hypothetical protein [Nocardiopsis endophytica]
MGYDLKAVVADGGLLTAAAAEPASARIVPLGRGLGLVPVTPVLLAALDEGAGPPVHGFWTLTAGLERLLAEWSRSGAVAFLESEYFGGTGEENTAVWRAGRIVLGPLHLREDEAVPDEGTPVRRALRELGVTADADRDEFTVAGLDAHRSTECWAARPADPGHSRGSADTGAV